MEQIKSKHLQASPKKTAIVRACHTCGEVTNRAPSRKRDGTLSDKVFCNRVCYQESHKTRYSKAECKGCGELFTYVSSQKKEVKYCSVACTSKFRVSKCVSCKLEFSAIKYRPDNTGYARVETKTCSKKCLSDFYKNDESRKDKISKAFTGDKHPQWRGGISKKKQYRGYRWAHVREDLFKVKGSNCEVCNISRVESKLRYGCDLHVDHIVAWHRFDNELEANAISNLRPLCISCHGKGGSNVEHGMYKKKKRLITEVYKSGNSKLTINDCKAIKSEYKGDWKSWSNASELSKKYDVSTATIRNIAKGDHWSDEYING